MRSYKKFFESKKVNEDLSVSKENVKPIVVELADSEGSGYRENEYGWYIKDYVHDGLTIYIEIRDGKYKIEGDKDQEAYSETYYTTNVDEIPVIASKIVVEIEKELDKLYL